MNKCQLSWFIFKALILASVLLVLGVGIFHHRGLRGLRGGAAPRLGFTHQAAGLVVINKQEESWGERRRIIWLLVYVSVQEASNDSPCSQSQPSWTSPNGYLHVCIVSIFSFMVISSCYASPFTLMFTLCSRVLFGHFLVHLIPVCAGRQVNRRHVSRRDGGVHFFICDQMIWLFCNYCNPRTRHSLPAF